MRRRSKTITYSALTAAIAVICMIIAQFIPLQAPLFVCAICFYIALDKCGIVFGFLSIVVSVLLILIMGFLGTALFVAILFAPYGIIAYFIRKLTYVNPWHITLRVIISVVFGNIVLASIYFLAHLVLPEINLEGIIQFVGGYIVLAVFVSLFFIVTDYFFRQFCLMFNRILK